MNQNKAHEAHHAFSTTVATPSALNTASINQLFFFLYPPTSSFLLATRQLYLTFFATISQLSPYRITDDPSLSLLLPLLPPPPYPALLPVSGEAGVDLSGELPSGGPSVRLCSFSCMCPPFPDFERCQFTVAEVAAAAVGRVSEMMSGVVALSRGDS